MYAKTSMVALHLHAMTNRNNLFTQQFLCGSGVDSVSSISATTLREEDHNSPPPRREILHSSNANSFLIRMAIRISRARWYSFLRRVFYYQNNISYESTLSASDHLNIGSNPYHTATWMVLESIALIIQIMVITYTLNISKEERPVWPMRLWISGYDLASLLSLVLLLLRYRFFHSTMQRSSDDVQHHQRIRNEEYYPRRLNLMNKLRTCMELFLAIWFVMGNIWLFDSRFGSSDRAPKLHLLCIFLLVWNATTYSFPFLLFLFLCCCVPLISNLLGYNMNMGSIHRGASDEQLSHLISWKYKEDDYNIAGSDLEHGKSLLQSEYKECCICLGKYKEKEEMRQLPCSHVFHLKCVDQWLRIISCCPLCKQQLKR